MVVPFGSISLSTHASSHLAWLQEGTQKRSLSTYGKKHTGEEGFRHHTSTRIGETSTAVETSLVQEIVENGSACSPVGFAMSFDVDMFP